jgi:hypothetical protein
MAAIFLSYSRADRPKAQVFAEALAAEGFSVWWDKVLRAGQTYDEVTEGMLRDADVVVVLWSTVSVKSKWVRTEATLGQRTSILIPAMIEDAERPIMFELTQSADLIGWDGNREDPRWKEFVLDIRRAVEHATPAEAKPSAPLPAPGQAGDMTMELTFWTSVKDSRDQADFEAYLKRYPDGHYSDLARNRIAAIARAETKPAPPPPPPPSPPPPPLLHHHLRPLRRRKPWQRRRRRRRLRNPPLRQNLRPQRPRTRPQRNPDRPYPSWLAGWWRSSWPAGVSRASCRMSRRLTRR